METDAYFQAAFMDYYNKHQEFSPEAMGQADWSELAKKGVSYLLKIVDRTYNKIYNKFE